MVGVFGDADFFRCELIGEWVDEVVGGDFELFDFGEGLFGCLHLDVEASGRDGITVDGGGGEGNGAGDGCRDGEASGGDGGELHGCCFCFFAIMGTMNNVRYRRSLDSNGGGEDG